MINYVLDLTEAGLYSIFYFIFAMYFGGLIEDLFPHYQEHTIYWCVLLEVLGQAMLNSASQQITMDLVQRLPIPDLGAQGKALAAKGGGIIFGVSLFARQTQWKRKVAVLAALDDKIFIAGIPAGLFPKHRLEELLVYWRSLA